MQTSDIIAEFLGLGLNSVLPEQGLCEQIISMRSPSAPIFLSPLELSGLFREARVDPTRVSARPVTHVETDGIAVRDLDRMGKGKVNGSDDPEVHYWCEVHPDVDVRAAVGGPAVDAAAAEITALRCGETVDRIIAELDRAGGTTLLVCHGASARYVMRHLTQDATATSGTVASIAVLTQSAGGRWTATEMSNSHLSMPPPESPSCAPDADNT